MQLRRGGDRSALMLMLNTVLFGTGAGLVTLAWMDTIVSDGTDAGLLSAMFNFEQPLLLITVAILLGGVFHTFTVLYPALIANRERQQKVLNQISDYRDQAYHDPLTRLHNRRYFDHTIKAYFDEFAKVSMPFGLLTFDVDHFKAINDTYGHSVGDLVLKEIASCSMSLKREHDVIARVGGEEFAVILAYINQEQLRAVGERYRQHVETLEIAVGDHLIRTTISVGAVLSTGFDELNAMIEEADARLYKAKNSGRNCVVAG